MNELKEWLLGGLTDSELPQEELSNLRMQVFRAFCVLKTIDLDNMYELDFNVGSGQPFCGEIFRSYILKTMWTELGLSIIDEEELQNVFNVAT